MHNTLHPVILCGGSGTRLWPRSRPARPKPFLPLLGDQTLFQQTLARVQDATLFAPPVVVAGEAHRDYIMAQAGSVPGLRRVEEPAARGTAPAIALAASRFDPADILLVCPSDHRISDTAAFHAATRSAATLAGQGHLVVFGIEATAPETGYGYIQRGVPCGSGFAVQRFVEKPDRTAAEALLADGRYSWNSGIFCFQAGTYLAELARQRPAMAEAVRQSVALGAQRGGIFHPDPASFAPIESESIDYAVMEHTARAAVIPLSCGWSDLGSWPALHAASARDAQGNSVHGRADLVDCRNVHVDSDGPRVSAIGLEDVIIVVDGDEVLVTTAQGAQKVARLKGADQP